MTFYVCNSWHLALTVYDYVSNLVSNGCLFALKAYFCVGFFFFKFFGGVFMVGDALSLKGHWTGGKVGVGWCKPIILAC